MASGDAADRVAGIGITFKGVAVTSYLSVSAYASGYMSTGSTPVEFPRGKTRAEVTVKLVKDTREKTIDLGVLRSRGITLPVIVASTGLVGTLIAIGSSKSDVASSPQPTEGIGAPIDLARALFLDHALAFQGIGVLLLTTTIAVLVLAKRERGAQPQVAVAAAKKPEAPASEEREPVLAGDDR